MACTKLWFYWIIGSLESELQQYNSSRIIQLWIRKRYGKRVLVFHQNMIFFQMMLPFSVSLIILAFRTLLVTALYLNWTIPIHILTITRKSLMIISTILLYLLIHFAIASMVILDIHALKVSNICLISEYYGPLTRCVKLGGCAFAGNAGNVSPPPWVSDPDMHHGPCIT